MGFIDDQYKEINLHIRHVAQLVIAWYTFFITGNIIGVGWFVIADPSRLTKEIVVIVACVFVLVCGLGIAAMLSVNRYFAKENERVEKLIGEITFYSPVSELVRVSPVPLALYLRAVNLASCSLWVIMVAWMAIARAKGGYL